MLIHKKNDLITKEDSVGEEPSDLTLGFTCDECGKVFKCKSYLKRHMLIHSGVKAYTCDLCKKTFTQKGNLGKHRLTHSGLKAFSCNPCKKVFACQDTLDKHMLCLHVNIF